MNELSFAYWLQGYFELTDSGQPLSAQQVQVIKDHLELVFKKVTPTYSAVKLSTPVPVDGYGVDLTPKDMGYGFTNEYKGITGIFRAKTLEDIEWEEETYANSPMFKYPNGYIERSC